MPPLAPLRIRCGPDGGGVVFPTKFLTTPPRPSKCASNKPTSHICDYHHPIRSHHITTTRGIPRSLPKMVSSSKEKRLAKKAAAGDKKTPSSRLSSKAGSKVASTATSDNEEQLDAHGNPIQSDEPATGAEKMDAVTKLKDQVDSMGLSDRIVTGRVFFATIC